MAGKEFERLLSIMEKLRGENGCPWDRKQTLESLLSYLLEEAYEVIDAVRKRDYVSLREELGDLLLQVVFQAQIAKEEGLFDIKDVIRGINEKLIKRHPHVFGNEKFKDAEDVLLNWENMKKKEKERDLEMEALLDVLNQKISLKVVVNTRDEIEKALELKKELGVHIILEQAEESFLLTKELKAEDVPVIVGPYFIAGRMYHQRYHYVKYAFKLYEDGVLFALTTDHPTVPVHFLYPMSVLFVKAGMPELDALRLISTNPAKILGMDKETGTIEVGKRANLVFLSDEPYTLHSEVVGHMIEGEMVWKNF